MDCAIHPIADIFPSMTDEEFTALRDDIAANGLREPITLWCGAVIDGRHRLRACNELGIEPDIRHYNGDESTLTSYVISLNLHRRHLDASQRAMVAAKLATMSVGRPSKWQYATINGETYSSHDGGPMVKTIPPIGGISTASVVSVGQLPTPANGQHLRFQAG